MNGKIQHQTAALFLKSTGISHLMDELTYFIVWGTQIEDKSTGMKKCGLAGRHNGKSWNLWLDLSLEQLIIWPQKPFVLRYKRKFVYVFVCVFSVILEEIQRTACRPREVCVEVAKEYPETTSQFYLPRCVSLHRCGGCCNNEAFYCTNTSHTLVNKTVSDAAVAWFNLFDHFPKRITQF